MRGEAHKRWYAVMCGGSAGFHERRRIVPEFKAVARMGDEGYEAFCPTMQVITRARRGQRLREMRVVPLWKGYCFARLDAWALHRRMQVWHEAFDVIRRDGQPYALGDDLIASVRALDQALQCEDMTGKPSAVVEQLAHLLKVGDVVEHRGAAYERLRGRITKIDRDNIVMLVDLLFGASRTIKAKASDVGLVL